MLCNLETTCTCKIERGVLEAVCTPTLKSKTRASTPRFPLRRYPYLGMATWVPPRAPSLWGHLFWERLYCSRVMHVASLGNPNPDEYSTLQDSAPNCAFPATRIGTS
ncbi:hypothetical protein VNO80_26989 [Phaseolus coccineus]|uniref:Uncharacterized protein n=1 Tax=Phaseolus coccineus TaxID=3886 RepID=A0AAN9LJ17_PHACN